MIDSDIKLITAKMDVILDNINLTRKHINMINLGDVSECLDVIESVVNKTKTYIGEM